MRLDYFASGKSSFMCM